MEKELLILLQNKNFEEAGEFIEKFTPEETAELLTELASINKEDFILFCQALESEQLADALVLLETDLQELIIGGLRDDELEAVMDEVSVDDTVDIIEEMPEAIVRRIAE
ncbi:MAG: hypothetical protein IKZ28_05935, partial [Clostridia bacterium]|nr:hypothetical protein [Clostridia bacterium]